MDISIVVIWTVSGKSPDNLSQTRLATFRRKKAFSEEAYFGNRRKLESPRADQLLDHLRTRRAGDVRQGLGVGNGLPADAPEVAADDIGAHFAFEHGEAPIAAVFEKQQTQHDLGRRGGTAALARFGMAASERLPDDGEQLVVLEQTIGLAHPRLVEIKRIFGEEGFEQAELTVTRGCHSLLRHKSDNIVLNSAIRLVLDNHSAHISKEMRAFLATLPNRFEFTFTPKHGSGLNLIESFFGKMTKTLLRGIQSTSSPRRG